MSSPKLLRKISCKGRPLRVLILGQPAVGKTALAVRFVTQRFIGDYDPTLERRYRCQRMIEGEAITFDVFDTAGQMGNDNDDLLEDKLRWADAFILVYSITDRCSLDECTRLKFLISHNANKRLSRKLSHDSCSSSGSVVALVGNKNDLEAERMVSVSEGKERSCQLGCSAFYDISVRESYEEANRVFEDLYRIMKKRTQVSKTSRKNCLKHQDAVTDSPPTPHILDCKSSLDSPSPPSPRRRESRVPVLGFSKDEPSEDHLYHNVLHISDSVSDTHLTCSDHRDQRDTQRKRSVSKRIISRVIPSLSSSSRENDSFRSDSDLTADSS